MDIPSAVWVVDLLNSAPVISHTGALWNSKGEASQQNKVTENFVKYQYYASMELIWNNKGEIAYKFKKLLAN